MNNLIVATDFSAAADNAILYGAALARHCGAPLLLVHVYQLPIAVSDMPVLMVSPEELQETADRRLDGARETVLKNIPGIEVRTLSRLGAIEEELVTLAREENAALIIAGNEHRSGLEKWLLGNTLLVVAREVSVPVLGVPDGWQFGEPLRVALATDLSGKPGFPYERIRSLVSLLQAELLVVHVQTGEGEDLSKARVELQSELGLACELVHNENYLDGIRDFIRERGINLLAVVPHQHSFLQRMFSKTHTQSVVEEIEIPVLCLTE